MGSSRRGRWCRAVAGGQSMVDDSTAMGSSDFNKETCPSACCVTIIGNGATGNDLALTFAAVHFMVQLFEQLQGGTHTDGAR